MRAVTIQDERDKLNSDLVAANKDCQHLRLRVTDLEKDLAEEKTEVKRVTKLLTQLEIAGDGLTAVVLDEDLVKEVRNGKGILRVFNT